jgi:hypothetical protein
MYVTARSDDELRKLSQRKLLPPGVYDARILAAQERPAKSGRDMLVFVVGVTDANGSPREIIDYLTDSPISAARLRSACAACDLLSAYDAGEVSATGFAGKPVRVHVGVEKGKRGYSDRNRIDAYSVPTTAEVVLSRVAE